MIFEVRVCEVGMMMRLGPFLKIGGQHEVYMFTLILDVGFL